MPTKTKQSKITQPANGCFIKIHVHSGKPSFRVGKQDAWTKEWTINVTSRPVKNLANEEIIRELTRMFHDCRLVLGQKSPHKTVWVNATRDEVEKAFNA